MRRRDLILGLGGVALTWPLAARAQQKPMPVIGLLHSGSLASNARFVDPFHEGLGEAGYVEGRNVVIEYREAEGHYDRLPALAADLVRRQATVMVAISLPAALAAKAATAAIPIVFFSGGDPVDDGLVASFNRPGANLTGVSAFSNQLGAKRIELLRALVPKAVVIGFLVNPSSQNAALQSKEAQEAARATGLQIVVVGASTDSEIDTAFVSLGKQRVDALLVAADVFLPSRRERLVALAARYAIPAMYANRPYAEAGGLISYGNTNTDTSRQVGIYAGRILRGAKPADLPIIRATRFELVLNLKTAKALGLTVPQSLFALADEVIE